MPSVFFEIGDVEYEVEAAHYEPGVPATRWEPGESGEVEPGDWVYRLLPHTREQVSYNDFVSLLAEERSLAWGDADELVRDKLFEACTEYYADLYDDRDEP